LAGRAIHWRTQPAIRARIGGVRRGGLLPGIEAIQDGSHTYLTASAAMSPAIVVHLLSVIPALGLGGFLLLRRKGTVSHRILGRIYVVLMLTAAISSFWIKSGGHFSFIHLFSIWTFISLGIGIWQITHGNIAGHRRAMTGMYVGLVAAGVFAFIPGRFLAQLTFG
jgi:uncharacterized membrane protein